jgi:predicted transcriptional regulator
MGSVMRRSKLEMYIDTLEALAYYGPLKLTRITYKAKLNCSVLKQFLDDLIKQNLVEERIIGKKTVVYALTQKARTVLKHYRELTEMLPIIEGSSEERTALCY